MNPKTVLCFFAKILVLKHEAKESKVRSRLSLSLFSLALMWKTFIWNVEILEKYIPAFSSSPLLLLPNRYRPK